jgi:hypothetical protein
MRSLTAGLSRGSDHAQWSSPAFVGGTFGARAFRGRARFGVPAFWWLEAVFLKIGGWDSAVFQ